MAKSKSEIEISLTDFVDFVCKTGGAKLTKVKQIKGRDDKYSPATDFYKAVREGIVSNHIKNGTKKDLDKILDLNTDPKKKNNYTKVINGYKKFWGNKKIVYFKPDGKNWKTGDLDVRVNPELGIEFNGKRILLKLFLKSDKLGKDKVEQILTLMESELRSKVGEEVIMGILDVKNGKIFTKDGGDISLLPLLEGEARSFETIWKGI